MITVSQIWIYPFKSARGISLPRTRFDAEGLLHDRRLVALDEKGLFLTARRYPQLLQLACTPEASGWRLQYPDTSEDCFIEAGGVGELSGRVWKDEITAQDAGDEAAAWLSEILGINTRIALWQKAARHAGKYGMDTSFADAAPLLVVSEASIQQACAWGGVENDVRRFRPNIVLSGVEAFAEEAWKKFRIGEAEFELLDSCSRCILTTRDPDSGVAHPDKQPLQALLQHHTSESGEALLGMNAVLRAGFGGAEVVVGDKVTAVPAPSA